MLEAQELMLDLGAQLVGVAALRIGRLDRIERGQGVVQRSAGGQPARLSDLATAIRNRPAVQQLFGFTLPLGLRTASPLDVGARSRVRAIEKQDARPYIDRLIVLAGEVAIEPVEQQLFDSGVAISRRRDGFGLV